MVQNESVKLNVKAELAHFISNDLLGDDQEVGEDDDLLVDGMIDSIGMMRLMVFIEESLRVSVPPEDFTIENFGTINVMGDYLVMRTGRYGKFLSCGRFPECRVAISTRPGERATGEVKENWEIAWKTAMEKCAIVHPEAAAAVAAEAEAKRGSRGKRRSANGKAAGKSKRRTRAAAK